MMPELDLAALHSRLVAAAPLIQNITNTVVQQFTANVLLAVGAAPAMIDHEADAAQFATVAQAVLVNLGTATNQQLLAADAAISAARQANKPWVLDPVGIGAADYRTARIRQVAGNAPTAVRGNASEIIALAGLGHGGRGVDATDEVEAALPAASRLARSTGGVVAVSGIRDAVVAVTGDRVRVARIRGGHALMARVIGTGCSLGAVTAAYLAVRRSGNGATLDADFEAVVAAHAHFARAGSVAASKAFGPGSYAVAFLDALHEIADADLAAADVTVEEQAFPEDRDPS